MHTCDADTAPDGATAAPASFNGMRGQRACKQSQPCSNPSGRVYVRGQPELACMDWPARTYVDHRCSAALSYVLARFAWITPCTSSIDQLCKYTVDRSIDRCRSSTGSTRARVRAHVSLATRKICTYARIAGPSANVPISMSVVLYLFARVTCWKQTYVRIHGEYEYTDRIYMSTDLCARHLCQTIRCAGCYYPTIYSELHCEICLLL
jgi:hypothetical protein